MPYHTPDTLPATFICRRLRMPNDLGFIMAVNGALFELTREYNWEQTTAVTPAQAAQAATEMLLDTLDSECPDQTPEPGEKLVFGPDASLISYAPFDPFTGSEIVPQGYTAAPLYRITEGVLPFPGVQVGDVLTDLQKLPTAWPPLLPPDGYPRFRVNFHVTGPGPGEVELHLVKLPLGGLALVTLDGDPGTTDFIDLATVDALDLTDLGALLGTVLDGDLVRTHIQELHVAQSGDHFIDVTFLPKLGTSSLVGFGGGLRNVILGGTAEAGTMPTPQFRLNGENLEWRPNEAHVWVDLGDVVGGIDSVSVTAIASNQPADAELENGHLELWIPQGQPGEQGPAGPPGQDAQILDTAVSMNALYDSRPELDYDQQTGELTLHFPTPFATNLRQKPGNPLKLEYKEWSQSGPTFGTWVEWADLGQFLTLPVPPPPPGQDIECLAAANAENVLYLTYVDVDRKWADVPTLGDIIGAEVASTLSAFLAPIYYGFEAGARLLTALAQAVTFDETSYTPAVREELRNIILANLTLDIDNVPSIDFNAVKTAVNGQGGGVWSGINVILDIVGAAGLNIAATTTAITEAECGEPGWEYTVDFTEEAGLWYAQYFGGCTPTRSNGVGWVSCEGDSNYQMRLELLTPGGYDPALTITSVEVHWSVAGTNDQGTQFGQINFQGGGDAPYVEPLELPGTTSPQVTVFNHPGYTGVYSILVEAWGIPEASEMTITKITVRGLGDNPYL